MYHQVANRRVGGQAKLKPMVVDYKTDPALFTKVELAVTLGETVWAQLNKRLFAEQNKFIQFQNPVKIEQIKAERELFTPYYKTVIGELADIQEANAAHTINGRDFITRFITIESGQDAAQDVASYIRAVDEGTTPKASALDAYNQLPYSYKTRFPRYLKAPLPPAQNAIEQFFGFKAAGGGARGGGRTIPSRVAGGYLPLYRPPFVFQPRHY